MENNIMISRDLLERISTALSFANSFMSGFVGDDTQEEPVDHTVDEIGELETLVDAILVPLPGEHKFLVEAKFTAENEFGDDTEGKTALSLYAVDAASAEAKGRAIIGRHYGEVEVIALSVTEPMAAPV